MTTSKPDQAGKRTQTTVIDDTEFRYPVSTMDLVGWEEKHGRLTAENHEGFCDDVKCSRPDLMVGTQEMIDVCERAIEEGADYRQI